MPTDATARIAERYARALFGLAAEARAQEAVAGDLTTLSEAAKQPELARFFHTPLVSRENKAKAMDALLAKAKAHTLTRQFARRLALNNRLPALPAISAQFAKLLAEARGEAVATFTSARPMSATDVKALSSALAKAYGKNVQISQARDASLLSGFILKIGDLQMDYSLAGKLNRLHMALRG